MRGPFSDLRSTVGTVIILLGLGFLTTFADLDTPLPAGLKLVNSVLGLTILLLGGLIYRQKATTRNEGGR